MRYWIAIILYGIGLQSAFFRQTLLGEEAYSGYPYLPASYSFDERLELFPLTGKHELEVTLTCASQRV
jgi:hypothetical protein